MTSEEEPSVGPATRNFLLYLKELGKPTSTVCVNNSGKHKIVLYCRFYTAKQKQLAQVRHLYLIFKRF